MNSNNQYKKISLPKGRIFLFCDETGDPGHPVKKDSSSYYQINFLIIHRDSLQYIHKYMSAFRYYKEAYKELKAYYRDERIILEILENLSGQFGVKMVSFVFEKTKYIKNYMESIEKKDSDYSSIKFRNHVAKEAIRYIFKNLISFELEFNNAEIIFDRYYEDSENEINFKQYIQDGYELPVIDQVIQVDSGYCEGVQIADSIGRIVKGNEFDLLNKKIDFIDIIKL